MSRFCKVTNLNFSIKTDSSLALSSRASIRSWSQLHIICKVELSLWIILARKEVDYEIILDSKDGIGSEVWVVAREDLSCDWLVIVCGDL